MKHLRSILAGMFVVAAVLTSCRPDITGTDIEKTGESPNYYDFSQIFESFWRVMDRNYMFWSEEPGERWNPMLDRLPPEQKSYILKYPESFWDRIYDHYMPQFKELGTFVGPPNSLTDPLFIEAVIKAYGMFYEIAMGLMDGHLYVFFYPDVAIPHPETGEMSPLPMISAQEDHIIQGYFMAQDPAFAGVVYCMSDLSETDLVYRPMETPFTYDYYTNVLERKYLTASSVKAYRNPEKAKIIGGRIGEDEDILYLHFNTCHIRDIMEGMGGYDLPDAREVIQAFLDGLEDPAVKGIVMDLRGCTGGDRADVGYLFGRMIDAPLTFAYSRTKSGEGRLDYSPWMPVQVMPAPATEQRLRNTNVPIVLLVDKIVNSTAEYMARVVLNMPNGTVMGGTTGGGGASTYDVVGYPNAFAGTLFWSKVSMAKTQFRGTDGLITESKGLKPDKEIVMNYNDWMDFYGVNGAENIKDKILDAAIEHIVSAKR